MLQHKIKSLRTKQNHLKLAQNGDTNNTPKRKKIKIKSKKTKTKEEERSVCML